MMMIGPMDRNNKPPMEPNVGLKGRYSLTPTHELIPISYLVLAVGACSQDLEIFLVFQTFGNCFPSCAFI